MKAHRWHYITGHASRDPQSSLTFSQCVIVETADGYKARVYFASVVVRFGSAVFDIGAHDASAAVSTCGSVILARHASNLRSNK